MEHVGATQAGVEELQAGFVLIFGERGSAKRPSGFRGMLRPVVAQSCFAELTRMQADGTAARLHFVRDLVGSSSR